MELSGQDKEIGMPSLLGYNPPNRESSSKISSMPNNSTVVGEKRDQTGHANTIFNPTQTLDHQPLYQHQQQPQQLNPDQQQNPTHKPRRDPDPNPDPLPPPPQIATTSATGTSIPGGSTLKPPPLPLPPPPTAAAITSSAAPSVRYRECLKNHAASMGGHVVDGCGEFMSSGEEGTLEAMKCAACECHRNFHRKEINGESPCPSNCTYYAYNSPDKKNSQRYTIPPLPPQLPLHQHHRFSHGLSTTGPLTAPIAPMTMMAFGGCVGGPAESSSEDLNIFHSNVGGQIPAQPPLSKKRFRTKFSQEQKEKMMEFAEKLGWKIQKQDEQEVQQFCSQVGIKRQVFKVWMHNNKQAMKKKQM